MVRRATGKRISQVLREEVAGPLGVPDEIWFGMPPSGHGRLARLEDAEGSAEMLASLPRDLPMFRTAPPELLPTAAFGNRADILAADIPAGGKMSARAVARMYAALLGEVDGVRLISPQRLREVSAVAISGVDEVFGNPVQAALGYFVGGPGPQTQGIPTMFGVGGAGGTFACADPATGTAFALSKNRLSATFDTVDEVAGIVAKAVAGG